MAEIIELALHRPSNADKPQKKPSKYIQTHAVDEEGKPDFFDEETWFTLDLEIQEEDND